MIHVKCTRCWSINKCKGKFGGNDSGHRCGETAGAGTCNRPQEFATSSLVNEMETIGFANGEKDEWL
jgi:hypothetical protein